MKSGSHVLVIIYSNCRHKSMGINGIQLKHTSLHVEQIVVGGEGMEILIDLKTFFL